MLLERVWTSDIHVTERSVDTLVKRLRQKIEADSARSAADPHGVGHGLQVREARCLRLVWYRSLYWRIALGFVALLATLLAVQGTVFLWMTGRDVGVAARPIAGGVRADDRRAISPPRCATSPISISTRI